MNKETLNRLDNALLEIARALDELNYNTCFSKGPAVEAAQIAIQKCRDELDKEAEQPAP